VTIQPNVPLVYSQSQGTLAQNGKVIARGYSGHGLGKNNPRMQARPNVGPIPVGRYSIGAPTTFKGMPNSMPLSPTGPNPTGRAGFMIHGGNAAGTSSRGCVILDPHVRAAISGSGIRTLIVRP
jgi:hypothetical protein